MPTIMLVGMGRAGKDEGGLYLEKITGLKFAGTTSKYLCDFYTEEYGGTWQENYDNRHSNRMKWYELGNRLREKDPGLLLRQALKHGSITGGVRDKCEVVYARENDIVDLVVWVENKNVPVDPTVMFTAADCDMIVENNGTLEEYHHRLRRLAKFAGLYNTQSSDFHFSFMLGQ